MEEELFPTARYEDDEQAYRLFESFMNEGKYGEAYRVFNGNPNLIDFIPVGEVTAYYTYLKNNLGDAYSSEFKYRLREKLEEIDMIANMDGLLSLGEKGLDNFIKEAEDEDGIR